MTNNTTVRCFSLLALLLSFDSAAQVLPDPVTGAAAARDAELAKIAGPLVDTFSNSGPALSPDGRLLAFLSGRDGLPQAYLSDAAKASSPARRLVNWPERISDVEFTPDGKAVLFRSDQGADERWSIYRVPVDGGNPVELTPGERLNRDGAIVPEGAPSQMFFSARKMSEPNSAIYQASSQDPTPAPKVIYRDEQPGFLVDVRDDAKSALFVRFPSRSENYVLTVDLMTGAARQIYPKSGQVSVFDAEFSADGKRVFVATDAGAEQALILALDAATGDELARSVQRPATATIAELSVSQRGDRIALALNAGNHSELRLLDARTLEPKAEVKMPLGLGTIGEFSNDGKILTAVWSTPTQPTDVFRINPVSGQVSPLRTDKRDALARMPEVDSSIVEIDGFDGTKIPINVYLPKGKAGKKLPVIVSYHGGPAGNSAIRWSPSTLFYLSQGYAWVEPNVRGSGGFGRAFEAADNGAKRLEAFRDIEASGRWVAQQPWADPSRLIVHGGSYGGYTVLIGLTRQPDLWRAGIDLFGVADLKTFMATTSGMIHRLFLLEFGDPEKDSAFLDSISPVRDAGKIVDPLFVYAGANDPRVPRPESDLIVQALRDRRVPVEYMVKENEGHSLARRESQIEFLSRSARFLETHLK